jgi:1-acyl-sn-glycerol-3-phosphate acyltransferase
MIKKPFQVPYPAYHIFKASNKIIIDNILGRSFEAKYEHVFNFSRMMIDAFDIQIQFSGLENYILGPAIICQNHTSVLDFPVLLHENIPGRKYFSAKISLREAKIPLFQACNE